MNKITFPQAQPYQVDQAASNKETNSQTKKAIATIVEVQHQEQPQAGGSTTSLRLK